MNRASAILLAVCMLLPALFAAAQSPLLEPVSQAAPSSTAAAATGEAQLPAEAPKSAVEQAAPLIITALTDSHQRHEPIGLNEKLLVQLGVGAGSTAMLDAAKYVLFLDGTEVQDLPDATFNKDSRSLVFELKRKEKNKDLWATLLGAPSLAHPFVEVSVSLGEKPADNTTAKPTIGGVNGSDTLLLKVFGPWSMAIASLLIGGVIWLVVARAQRNTTLRDSYLPQIEPAQQTYSLARCQMAFWFVLIFCSFVFLYIATWDYNTVSQQALELMGISGATALAAVAVDYKKDSPADAVNRGLQARGVNSYDEVVRMRDVDIPRMQAELQAKKLELEALPRPPTGAHAPPPSELQQQWMAADRRITQLTLDINDRRNRLTTYEANILPFKTQGFFKDVTTDINGTAIHRLQVFCWTIVLGGVFIIGVYRNLAMPEFGGTLLALMGISGAGYVGFKIPENNS